MNVVGDLMRAIDRTDRQPGPLWMASRRCEEMTPDGSLSVSHG